MLRPARTATRLQTSKVIAQTTDGGGAIVGMPRCEVRSWSLRRTEADGVTRILAEYTPGFRMLIR